MSDPVFRLLAQRGARSVFLVTGCSSWWPVVQSPGRAALLVMATVDDDPVLIVCRYPEHGVIRFPDFPPTSAFSILPMERATCGESRLPGRPAPRFPTSVAPLHSSDRERARRVK